MKRLKTKIVSCALAVLTACTFGAVAMQKKKVVSYAASNEVFLSDVALVYEDSVEKAQAAIAGTEWKLYNKDLNPNADYIFDDGVYLVYKTSTNVEDAITDLRVMDMYGGYATTNYKKQLEKSRSEYKAKVDELRIAANEFKTLYEAGDDMAELAYRQMNYYQDMKITNGTETDMYMGEFFLNMPTDDQVVQVVMEGNSMVVTNLMSLLAVGLSGGSSNLGSRIAEQYEIKDTLSSELYHESARTLSKSFAELRKKLVRFDDLKEKYNLEDDKVSEEEYVLLTEFATLADLLTTITYGETTLADFIKADAWTVQDLYPIVAAFTPGQKALVDMGMIETVLKYNQPSQSIEELTAMVEEMEADMLNEDGTMPVYDVYAGVDRSIFRGDFAMTTEAQRQQALTGKTWDMSDARGLSTGQMVGFIIGGVVDLALAGASVGIAIKTAMINAAIETARLAYVHATSETVFAAMEAYEASKVALYGTWANPSLGWANMWGALQVPLAVAAVAVTIIMAGAYGITTWYNYYNPDYLEIPNTIVDVKETDLGDKYVKYSAAKVIGGEEGQENADFNAYQGKEWNALYYTKDANAGNCLTPNFVYRENNSTVAKRHQGVSMFGENDAYNLNSHVYSKNAPGVYLSVRYSTTKKAAADMPTVVGSMFGGTYYILSAVGGAVVGVGGMVLFQQLKKKKKEEIAEETVVEETTTGE